MNPYLYNKYLCLSCCWIFDGDLLLRRGDHLDRVHELVADDGDSNKQVDHEDNVEDASADTICKRVMITAWPSPFPDGNDETGFTVDPTGYLGLGVLVHALVQTRFVVIVIDIIIHDTLFR